MATKAEVVFRIIAFAVVLALSVAYTVEATTFRELASYAPLFGGTVATASMSIVLVREVLRLRRFSTGEEAVEFSRSEEYAAEDAALLTSHQLRRAGIYLATFTGLVLLIWLFGFFVGSAIFLVVYLRADTDASWPFVGLSVAGVLGVLFFFSRVFGLSLLDGLVTGF